MKETKDIKMLEQQLDVALNPVYPHNDFVDDLKTRLQQKAMIAIEKPDYLMMILLIVSGLILGVVVFVILKEIFKINHGDD